MAETTLDLTNLYNYYINEGEDPATAAQYAVYYIPYGKKKSFTGITTPKFKTQKQILAEYAPNYTKFEGLNDPFWNKVIDVAKKGGTYLDVQKIVYGKDGQDYAAANNLYTPDGYVNTGALLTNAGRILNEYTQVQEQTGKQKKTFSTFAASIGAPNPDLRFSFKVNKSYDKTKETEYAPVRKVYDTVLTKLKGSLKQAGVSPTQAAAYVTQFNTAFETIINQKLSSSNLTPFTDYVVRKSGK